MKWGKKREEDAEVRIADEVEKIVAANESWFEKTKRLEDELAAIEAPADTFRISKDPETGTFTVSKWRKEIGGSVVPDGLGCPAMDLRYTTSYYAPLKSGLASLKIAEAWLKQYLDPSTDRTSYDASGNRIEAPA